MPSTVENACYAILKMHVIQHKAHIMSLAHRQLIKATLYTFVCILTYNHYYSILHI